MRDGLGGEPEAAPGNVPLSAETYQILPRTTARQRSPLGWILLCDHAGNAFPEGYGTLGLTSTEIKRHIAYDIGAAGVVRAMAARLGAAAVLSRYSRLLIDLNRGADDPTLIMRLSDGAVVPGNHPIDDSEWNRRIRLYYDPYHRIVGQVIRQTREQGLVPVIVSIHSYTEAWKGVARPWHAGILWDRDSRLPARLLHALRADPALVVGDNQPYSGQLEGDCLYRHATCQGLAHALIEIRQELIVSPNGQQAWADRLSVILEAIAADQAAQADLQPRQVAPHITKVSLAATPDAHSVAAA
jgi:predicted N-formylglutamate amidohydrolase